MDADKITLIAVGLAIFCFFSASFMLRKKRGNASRIQALEARRARLRGEMNAPRRRKGIHQSISAMRKVVERFKLLKNTQVRQIEDRMIEAGWRDKDALVIFAFFTLVTPVIFGLAGVVLMQMQIWGNEGMHVYMNLGTPIALVFIGMKLPTWVVARKRKKRLVSVQRALADTLDLMTICAEAGLSLAATLERVSKELNLAYPEMSEELSMTAMELNFLPERSKALMNLTERVKLQEVRGLISVLIQTEKYGTPIAQALRVLASEFREQRMLRAENKAARLPAIMTLPMILFILPTLFIIIMTPAVLRISDTWK